MNSICMGSFVCGLILALICMHREGDYNKASQKGMSMGGVRHAADMRMEPYVDIRGQGIITPQSGKLLMRNL